MMPSLDELIWWTVAALALYAAAWAPVAIFGVGTGD